MQAEHYAILVKELRRAAKSDKPFHWAFLKSDADGDAALIVHRKEVDLKSDFKAARKTAKDKKYARGRVTRQGKNLVLGVDDATAPSALIQRTLKRDLAVRKPIRKAAELLRRSTVCDGADWEAIQPSGAVSIHLKADELELQDAKSVEADGGRASDKSKRAGSVYARLLQALDDLKRDFRSQEITTETVTKAYSALAAIEKLAQQWIDTHAKRPLEGAKRKRRREAVEGVKAQITRARQKLDVASQIARVSATVEEVEDRGDEWDTTYRTPGPGDFAEARRRIGTLEAAVQSGRAAVARIDAPDRAKAGVVEQLEVVEEENRERHAHIDAAELSYYTDAAEALADALAAWPKSWEPAWTRDDLEDAREAAATILDRRAELVKEAGASPIADQLGGAVRVLTDIEPVARGYLEAAQKDALVLAKCRDALAQAVQAEKDWSRDYGYLGPANHAEAGAALDPMLETVRKVRRGIKRVSEARKAHLTEILRGLRRAIHDHTKAVDEMKTAAPILLRAAGLLPRCDAWDRTYASVDDTTEALRAVQSLDAEVGQQLTELPRSKNRHIERTRTRLQAAHDDNQARIRSLEQDGDALSAFQATLDAVSRNIGTWDDQYGDDLPIEVLSRARGGLEALSLALERARADARASGATPGGVKRMLASVQGIEEEVAERKTRVMRASIQDTVTDREWSDLERRRSEAMALAKEEARKRLEAWKDRVGGLFDDSTTQLGKKLGAGGFGEVYLIDGIDGGPPLVGKLGDEDEVEKEAEIYEQIPPHPNIARCLGVREFEVTDESFGFTETRKVLVMEAIEGGDMKGMTRRGVELLDDGSITQVEYWGAMQFMIRGLVSALAHLEENGLAHSDVKPDNFMFDLETMEPKLIDMGLVGDVGTHSFSGTDGYVGVSTDESVPYDEKGRSNDLFAVGSTVYEVGERDRFSYRQPMGMHVMMKMHLYVQSGAKALEKASGAEARKAGNYGARTAYVDFVNTLMDREPDKRPTYNEALRHPFLADSILDDGEAKRVCKLLGT